MYQDITCTVTVHVHFNNTGLEIATDTVDNVTNNIIIIILYSNEQSFERVDYEVNPIARSPNIHTCKYKKKIQNMKYFLLGNKYSCSAAILATRFLYNLDYKLKDLSKQKKFSCFVVLPSEENGPNQFKISTILIFL